METNCQSAVLENPAFCPAKAVSLIVEAWTLIGYSAFAIDNAKFIDANDIEYTWANALANNKLQAYLSYYDSSSATASERKFKYVGTSGVDDSLLRGNKGYWLYANEAGNLTLPGVGGSVATESYVWNKLRFVNSSGSEKSIVDAGSVGWIEMFGTDYIYYRGYDEDQERYTFLKIPKDTSALNPWQGYFIKSLQDNITLIRQN